MQPSVLQALVSMQHWDLPVVVWVWVGLGRQGCGVVRGSGCTRGWCQHRSQHVQGVQCGTQLQLACDIHACVFVSLLQVSGAAGARARTGSQ